MLSETNGNSKFNNGGTGALVIVKATKEATDTILYSQHVIKIGSHNGQGEGEGEGGRWTITKHHRHRYVWPR